MDAWEQRAGNDMQARILCSTGAFIGRPNGRDPRLMASYAAQLHCDGYEFLMFHDWHAQRDQIVHMVREEGLVCPVLHVEKQVGERLSRHEAGDWENAFALFEKNCEMAQAIGAQKLVLHLWGGLPSDHHIDDNFACVDRLMAVAQAHQLLLTVENVVCAVADPLTHLQALHVAFPTLCFTVDTKMAAFHAQMEEMMAQAWLWQKDCVRHLHINDYAGGYKQWDQLRTLPIGQGHVDFAAFFAFLQRIHYAHTLTVEATCVQKDGRVDVQTLNCSLDFLHAHLPQ